MSDTVEKTKVEPWAYVRGGIQRSGEYTIFTLVGLGGGHSVAISTDRLQRHPEVYKRTLDFLARDVEIMQKPYL